MKTALTILITIVAVAMIACGIRSGAMDLDDRNPTTYDRIGADAIRNALKRGESR